MSSVTITRQIDIARLAFPCTAVITDTDMTITAEVSQVDLEAAVLLVPTDISEANAQTIRTRAATALGGNRDFLALPSPTNAQNAAQIKALTRQMNGLIRLTLGQLDSTD